MPDFPRRGSWLVGLPVAVENQRQRWEAAGRSRDLLVVLAGDVAGMVEALRSQEAQERDLVRLAAATLRDAGTDAAARGAAAEALEQLAVVKQARLDG